MRGRARAAARRTLESTAAVFERAGYRVAASSDLERRLDREKARPLLLRVAAEGRIFGGSFALELASGDPVLPETQGLAGRGRGAVRLRAVSFRARRGDAEGARLADALGSDAVLQAALREVHFERVRIDPDGRAVIRHMGGSVVWVLFPPFVRPVPFPPGQLRAVVAALDAFAEVAR